MKELVDLLTRQLGVTGTQAEGGAAVLFKAAKDKLGADEFAKLLGGVPGMSELLKKAPASASSRKPILRGPNSSARSASLCARYRANKRRQPEGRKRPSGTRYELFLSCAMSAVSISA